MSLARARRASRIITFTSLITGAWLASVRRSSIVSSSSARTTRSPPRRSVACTSVGDSAWAERIAAWISAAGASTSFTRRSYVQHSSSITVGSGTSPAATSSSPASFTPTGRRQCSSRYLGDSRCANGPAAAARRSAPERAGYGGVSVEEPEERKVLEQRHAALGELLRLSDQPADHHRVPGLHDRARLRLAGGDHGSVLRRRHRLLRQRAHLLQHAEGDVA